MISALLKVLLQQLRGTLATAFERHLTVEDFMYVDNIGANYFLANSYHETKMAKGARQLSVVQKSEPVLRRALHQNVSLIIVFFFFSQTSLDFKFSLVLME